MKTLNRRDLIKSLAVYGGGVSILPLFGAQQKRSALAALDKNVVMISVGLGFLPQYFRPGRNSLNSRYLSSFAPVHDKMTIFNQIEQAERLGGHRNAHSVFTCQSRFGKIHSPFISLDQLLALKTVQETRHSYVSAGTRNNLNLSFGVNGLAVPSVVGVDGLKGRLFGAGAPTDELESKRKVLAEVKRQWGSEGHDKFYRSVLDENLETLDNEIKWSKVKPPEFEPDVKSVGNPIMDLSAQLELIKLGLAKKQCRIVSFAISHNGSIPLDGVHEGYHALSHHNEQKEKMDELAIIETYVAEQLAKFVHDLEKLKILDDTIVLIAGNMGDPSRHTMQDMSVILAGGGFKHQKIVNCKDKGRSVHTLANLYVSLLHQAGLKDIDSFAGVAGHMDDILT